MSRLSVFNSPFLLGFEPFEQLVDRVSKSAQDSYPPYNIEQIDSTHLRVTLAVAGFAEGDLAVTIEGNQLVVRGQRQDADDGRAFVHRGIAARQFQRSFLLADGLDVTGARLENGLLHVVIDQPLPDARRRTIEIKTGPDASISGEPTLKAVGED
jgi:HSP20 family molecular chaperone IbpA